MPVLSDLNDSRKAEFLPINWLTAY